MLSCSRMDSQVHRVVYPTRNSAGKSRYIYARIWQTERGGETLPRGQFSASQSSSVQYILNSFNNLFQEAERQRKEAEHQHEDEEGWVKVTRASKVKARPHSEAVNKRTLQKEMKKKKRKELLNFYSWQHKNTQKQRKQTYWIVYLPSTAFENLILISGKCNVH